MNEMGEAEVTTTFCGLDGGDENSHPSRKEINHFARRVHVFHVYPIKKKLTCIEKKLDAHCKEDEAIKNQVRGARWALILIGGALVSLVPFLWEILMALHTLLKGASHL